MEDFFYAGGLRGVARDDQATCSDLDARTVNGKTLGENIAGAEVFNDDVILPPDKALVAERKPRGAARQPRARRRGDQAGGRGAAAAASTPGRRSCSRITTTWRRASTIPRSTVTADSVLVLQERRAARRARACPNGASCRSRRSCWRQGVRDMVRISDARMSGTSYGACVLHVAPESFIGGPLALVRDGDIIALDVPKRRSS